MTAVFRTAHFLAARLRYRLRMPRVGSFRSRRAAGGYRRLLPGGPGVGLSQRAQSFVTDPADGPFNVIEPGRRPRVTLTPSLALKDGKPYLAFSVQGGDGPAQNILRFLLNTVEFGFNVQRATEAPNINSFQMRSSFGAHEIVPGKILLANPTPQAIRDELIKMGYTLTFEERTSARSPPSFSIRHTKRCGAERARTATIMELPGKKLPKKRRF